MAYIFNSINNALGKDKSVKQNIFDPSQNPNQPAGDASGMGMGQAPKTSTEGEMAGGGSTGTQQSAEGMPQDTKANDQRIVRQNKMGVPKFANQAEQDIGAAEKGLQDEANAYTQKAAATDFKVGESDIEKAIGNDEAAGRTVRDRLGADASMEGARYEGFKPTTNLNVADIDAMRTEEGTKGLLRRNAGANYNAGESAFDMMLLNRTPEFNAIRSSLGQRQDALAKQGGDFQTSKTDEARKAVETNYKAAQDQVRSSLGSKSGELLKAQEAEASAENAARAELRKTGNPALAKQKSDEVLARMKSENAGNDPLLAQLLGSGAGVNAADFYNVAGDVDYTSAIDDKEAARFNQINALLGKNDSWAAGGGLGDRETFDATGFQDRASGEAMKSYKRIKSEEAAAQEAARAQEAKRLQDMADVQAINDKADADLAKAAQDREAAKAAQDAEDSARKKRESERTAKVGGVATGVKNKDVDWLGRQKTNTGTPQASTKEAVKGGGGAINRAENSTEGKKLKAAGRKADPSKWCFPAGVRFQMADGSLKSVEALKVGDDMERGGVITTLHENESEDLYYLDGVLVTGSHAVFHDGEWALVEDIDDAMPVLGEYKVYSVTNDKHIMVHEAGAVFGDYDADDIFGVVKGEA